jgi:hypothetical protein
MASVKDIVSIVSCLPCDSVALQYGGSSQLERAVDDLLEGVQLGLRQAGQVYAELAVGVRHRERDVVTRLNRRVVRNIFLDVGTDVSQQPNREALD